MCEADVELWRSLPFSVVIGYIHWIACDDSFFSLLRDQSEKAFSPQAPALLMCYLPLLVFASQTSSRCRFPAPVELRGERARGWGAWVTSMKGYEGGGE